MCATKQNAQRFHCNFSIASQFRSFSKIATQSPHFACKLALFCVPFCPVPIWLPPKSIHVIITDCGHKRSLKDCLQTSCVATFPWLSRPSDLRNNVSCLRVIDEWRACVALTEKKSKGLLTDERVWALLIWDVVRVAPCQQRPKPSLTARWRWW